MPDHVPLPALAHFAPNIAIPSPHPQQQQQQQQQESAAADALSVVLVMRSYDGTVRYWDAWSGICTVTIQTQHHVRCALPHRRVDSSCVLSGLLLTVFCALAATESHHPLTRQALPRRHGHRQALQQCRERSSEPWKHRTGALGSSSLAVHWPRLRLNLLVGKDRSCSRSTRPFCCSSSPSRGTSQTLAARRSGIVRERHRRRDSQGLRRAVR